MGTRVSGSFITPLEYHQREEAALDDRVFKSMLDGTQDRHTGSGLVAHASQLQLQSTSTPVHSLHKDAPRTLPVASAIPTGDVRNHVQRCASSNSTYDLRQDRRRRLLASKIGMPQPASAARTLDGHTPSSSC